MINFIVFLLAAAHPALDTGSIASEDASYDGFTLVLDGGVSLDHGFGEMQAAKAVLTRPLESQADFPFTCIELADTVHISLKTEAQVDCERASLDFREMKGVLTSPKNVHYVDTINSIPFELFSPQLDLQIIQETYDIERAHAQKGVHLIYNQLYHLKTESIVFTNDTLYSDVSPCTWTHQNDHVDAEMFNLDLRANHLILKKAKGHMSPFSKGEVQFTDSSIDIDGEKKLATVRSHSSQLLYLEETMSLMADDAQMYYKESEEKLELQGHIKIFSHDQRGVADTLTYTPETRSCILKALPGQKVLFMRDQDQLCISANEVHITYNPVTKEQDVRGIGHITMTLSPEEHNLLNQVFHHESSAPKS